MENLVFACPSTGQPIDSGISTDRGSLVALRDLPIDVKCPHCADGHRFRVRTGYVHAAARDTGFVAAAATLSGY